MKNNTLKRDVSRILSWVVVVSCFMALPLRAEPFPPADRIAGDVSVSLSELGAGFGHIKYHSKIDAPYHRLLRREVLGGGGHGRVEIVSAQEPSEFHVSFPSTKTFEIQIQSLDSEYQIIQSSPARLVRAGSLIPVKTPKGNEDGSINGFEDGLAATLEIDATNFPLVKLLTEITQGGVPYDGDSANFPVLGLEKFSVTEDMRVQNILDNVIPPQQASSGARIADIVIIHDDSGSLDDEAAQVRANITSFLSALGGSNIDFRVGLLPYGGGGGLSGDNGTVLNGGLLYDNAAGFISDLDRLRFDGGRESAWNAVNTALSGISFREQTQRVLILIGDEDVQSSIGDAAIIQQLQTTGSVLFTLTSNDDRSRYRAVSEATGGQNFSITAPFNSILEEIGAAIAARYILTYNTDNPSFDGNEREVELTVIAPDPEGGADLEAKVSGRYLPSPLIQIATTPETDRLGQQGNRQRVAIPIVVKVNGGLQDSLGATLFYQSAGTPGFQGLAMSAIAVDATGGFTIFQGVVPPAAVLPSSLKYYVQVSDGSQTATLPSSDPATSPQVISILPNVAPRVDHVPVSTGIVGQPINIDFSVEDSTNLVEEARVFYRVSGTASYQQTTASVNAPRNSVRAVIPASVTTGAGVEYYIEAEDDFETVSQVGRPDQPLVIAILSSEEPSGSRELNNLKVYAENFSENGTLVTASGNVQVGRITGGPVLGFSGSLLMDTVTGKVTPLASQLVVALNIKLDGTAPTRNYQVFRGDFTIESVPVSPQLKFGQGSSLLRLVGSLPFIFPNVSNNVTIDDDKIVVNDTQVQITEGFSALFNVAPIELSQKGQSTARVTLTTPPGLEIPFKKSPKYSFTGLELTLDFIEGTVTGKAGFGIKKFFKNGSGGGFSGTLGFRISPFGVNTFGFSVPLNLPTIPPTIPLGTAPVGVKFTSGSFLLDNIVTEKPLKVTVSGGAKLTNEILDEFEDAVGIKLLSGKVSAGFDTSFKVFASGNLDLLEAFTLATVRVQIGNPTELEATINLVQTLVGRTKLSMGVGGGFFEASGTSKLTLQIPPAAPFIGGSVLADVDVQAIVRVNTARLQKAEYAAKVALFFVDVGVRLNLEGTNPNLFVGALGEEVQVFSDDLEGFAETGTFTIPAGQDCVIVRVQGDTEVSPEFTLTDPNGSMNTAAGITLDVNDPYSTPGITDAFFKANALAGEGFFALKNPIPGEYSYSISNDQALGNFNLQVLLPNDLPSLTFTSPSAPTELDGSAPVDIEFIATDADNEAVIDLYLDTDNEGTGGLLLVAGLKEGTDTSFSWTPEVATLSSGVYYLYARLDDGINTPVVVRNPNSITLTNPNAPDSVTNLTGTAGDGMVALTWDAAPDADLAAYRVVFSRTPGDGEFEVSVSADTNTSINIPNLANGVAYEFAVISVDDDQLESALAGPITLTPTGDAVGSFGDLTFDPSSISLTENGPAAILTFDVVNIGDETVFSSRVSASLGSLLDVSIVSEGIIGEIRSGSRKTVRLTFDSRTVAADDNNLFIQIRDVVLPEFNELNNTAFIPSTLPFVDTPIEKTPDIIAGTTALVVGSDPSDIDGQGNLRLNPQTGAYEHKITVENQSGAASGPLRLEIVGLPADVQITGVSGVDPNTGNPFLIFDTGVLGGSTLAFTLEYFRLNRETIAENTLSISVTATKETAPPVVGGATDIQAVLQAGASANIIQFLAEEGKTYGLEYSDDGLTTWKRSSLTIKAASSVAQFVDQGPPLTDGPPAGVSSRFYRIIEVQP